MDKLSLIFSTVALCTSIFSAVVAWRSYKDSAYRLSIHPHWSWVNTQLDQEEVSQFLVSIVNSGGREIEIRKIGFATAEREQKFRQGTALFRTYGVIKEFNPPIRINAKSGDIFECPLPDDDSLAREIEQREAFIWVEDGMFKRHEAYLY